MKELLSMSHYEVQVASSIKDLEAAKALDDIAFGTHMGITMEELMEIQIHGAVLLLKDATGKIIGESQVITSPVSGHDHLDEGEAYCYGTGIDPSVQNEGIGQLLFQAQEAVAIAAGKHKLTLTVRVENAKSIRGRLKAGYQIIGYNPNEYGSLENDGARLIMEKNLEQPTVTTVWNDMQIADAFSLTGLLEGSSAIGVPVIVGDTVDYEAHACVSEIISHGYRGVALLKPEEYGGTGKSLLIFIKPEAGI